MSQPSLLTVVAALLRLIAWGVLSGAGGGASVLHRIHLCCSTHALHSAGWSVLLAWLWVLGAGGPVMQAVGKWLAEVRASERMLFQHSRSQLPAGISLGRFLHLLGVFVSCLRMWPRQRPQTLLWCRLVGSCWAAVARSGSARHGRSSTGATWQTSWPLCGRPLAASRCGGAHAQITCVNTYMHLCRYVCVSGGSNKLLALSCTISQPAVGVESPPCPGGSRCCCCHSIAKPLPGLPCQGLAYLGAVAQFAT